MEISTDRAKLHNQLKDLRGRWINLQDIWDDSVRQEFEEAAQQQRNQTTAGVEHSQHGQCRPLPSSRIMHRACAAVKLIPIRLVAAGELVKAGRHRTELPVPVHQPLHLIALPVPDPIKPRRPATTSALSGGLAGSGSRVRDWGEGLCRWPTLPGRSRR